MKVKNSLDEILYEHIVESLINGDYEMGQNLTLDELAHRFEVSRTPVVQAVKLLANDGILQIMGNGRIYVPEYDQEHVRQMCEVRQMVEGHALERFMSGLGLSAESVLAQLNRYSEEGVRLTGSSFSPKEFAMLDRRFHRLLVEASGNRILLETYDRVQGRFLVSNYLLCPLRHSQRSRSPSRVHPFRRYHEGPALFTAAYRRCASPVVRMGPFFNYLFLIKNK